MARIESAYRFVAARYAAKDKIKGARTFNQLLKDGRLSKGVIGLSLRRDLIVPKRVAEYEAALDPEHLILPNGQQLVHFSIISSRQDIITTEKEARLFAPSIAVKPSKNLAPQLHPLFHDLRASGLKPEGMKFRAFLKGIRIALRNEQIETRFSNRVAITPNMIADVMSGNIFTLSDNRYLPIYARERMAGIDEARIWIEQYLLAAEGRIPFDKLDIDKAPKYFVVGSPSGDVKELRVTPHKAASGNAVFPGFNLRKGKFYYVELFYDNLVSLHFRILDKSEKVIKSYAYDASVPEKFALYRYSEEEKRQFEIFNQHLLSDEERATQARGIQTLKAICCTLMGIPSSTLKHYVSGEPILNFRLPGPARRLTLQLPEGKTTTFQMLHLDPQVVYEVNILKLKSPGSDMETPAVVFSPINGTGSRKRILYFSPQHNAFVQIFTRKLDEKDRIGIPEPLIPRPWDNEHDLGLIL